jgi:hypothetical protein
MLLVVFFLYRVDLTSSNDDDDPNVVVDYSTPVTPMNDVPGTHYDDIIPKENESPLDITDTMLVKAYHRSFLFKENEKELQLIMNRLHPLVRAKQENAIDIKSGVNLNLLIAAFC